jgi:hypothetical protein
MREHSSNHQEHSPLFSMGERVAVGRKSGVIVAAFPDGFHLVRIDETHEVTGAHFSQLVSIDDQHAGLHPRGGSSSANIANL